MGARLVLLAGFTAATTLAAGAVPVRGADGEHSGVSRGSRAPIAKATGQIGGVRERMLAELEP